MENISTTFFQDFNYESLKEILSTETPSTLVFNNKNSKVQITIDARDLNGYYSLLISEYSNIGEGSEDKFKALFDSALDGVVTINKNGRIISLNPATTKMFGYSAEELLGENISILMPEPDRSHHDQYIASYLKTGKRKIIGIGREVHAQKKDGNLLPIKLSITEIKSGGEKIFMGMMHDLTNQKLAEKKILDYSNELKGIVKKRTEEIMRSNKELEKEIRERKQIESELVEGQKLFHEIARNFPDGTISVLDEDLNYVFIDGKELFELNLSSASLIGTNIKDRLPEKIAFKLSGILNRVFQNKKETIEIEINKQSYMVTAVPLTDANNKVKRILVVEENITNQKKAEQKIKNALKKEMELNSLKSRFVSMASHEFRTPLSTVLSSATLVEKHLEAGNIQNTEKHLNRIKSAVSNLTEILNDMLSLSKLEEGIIRIRSEKVLIKDICMELVEEMQQQAKTGQKIRHQHKGSNSEILSDPIILKNILHNLISNAIKYSGENTEINLISEIAGSTLTIIVKDNGIGIPAEDQSFLFQKIF